MRIGVTAAKKIGGAVQRNRARRIIKEAYRNLCGQVRPGWNLVFVARAATVDKTSTQIQQVMHGLLEKAGVIG